MSPLAREPAAPLVRRIALEHLRDLGRARRRVLRAADPEALHDYRVVVRRLRSVLRALRPMLRPPEIRRLEKLFGRIARRTNRARDVEVLAAWLEGRQGAFPEPLAGVLVAALTRDRRRAEDAVAGPVRARVHSEIVDQFGLAFRQPEGLLVEPTRTFGEVAREAIRPVVREALDDAAALAESPSTPALHRLRISLKKVRYGLEAFDGVWPAAVRRFPLTLKALQDTLGGVHDLDVRAVWLASSVLQAERRRLREMRAVLAGLGVGEVAAVVGGLAVDPALAEATAALLAELARERELLAARSLVLLKRRGLPGLERLRLALEPAPAPALRRVPDPDRSAVGG